MLTLSFNDQVHITGTSRMELLTQWGLQHPLVELHERSEALLHCAQASEHPMVHHEQALTWLTSVSSDLHRRARAAVTKADAGLPVPEGAHSHSKAPLPGKLFPPDMAPTWPPSLASTACCHQRQRQQQGCAALE